MTILVFSDSHSSLRYMRCVMDSVQPDAVIHLGDYVCDGEAIASDYPQVPFYQVAGNCDRYRVTPDFPETLVEVIGGVRIYMTHGHLQRVKLNRQLLLLNARKCASQIVLYGHTHAAECQQLEDGVWLMNPGSCGYGDGFAGCIEIDSDKNVSCRLISYRDLEEIR